LSEETFVVTNHAANYNSDWSSNAVSELCGIHSSDICYLRFMRKLTVSTFEWSWALNSRVENAIKRLVDRTVNMSFFREETEKQVETSCLEDAVRSHRRCDCVTVTMTVSFCFIASLCTI